MDKYHDALTKLGFSGLESEIYIHLLRSEPSSGYNISQALGKPRANVYQSLESLFHKGAALMDEGGTRKYRAVDPSELIQRLEKEYLDNAAQACKVLDKIKCLTEDYGVYQMKTRAQTLERARVDISRAKRIILLDISTSILTELAEELQQAISRGVVVAALLYGEERIDGAIMYPHHRQQELRKRWQGEWLNQVSDGKYVIWSFLSGSAGEPVQALCSSSPFISWIYHSALAGEIMMSAMANAFNAEAGMEEFSRLVKEHLSLTPTDAPGALELERMVAK